MADLKNIKSLLDRKYLYYNNSAFIENDPILIPHRYTRKEDIEIAGFLSATIAWGQRKSIIRNCSQLMSLMDDAPFDFVISVSNNELKKLNGFIHRTFQGIDCEFFIHSLQNIYINHGGLEQAFTSGFKKNKSIFESLANFRKLFFSIPHPQRTMKHIANVESNASAKRLNMFLRWMVRNDDCGVDFGLWKNIPSSVLMLPLDVHTGNVARELGILKRTLNDWKSVEEVTAILKSFDPEDPVKYDFALFGMGVDKKSSAL
jgi:uncharacterized protein (TIGR02757 family)